METGSSGTNYFTHKIAYKVPSDSESNKASREVSGEKAKTSEPDHQVQGARDTLTGIVEFREL